MATRQSRASQKAQYRASVSHQSDAPTFEATPMTDRQTLGTAGTNYTTSSIVERNRFRPPADKKLKAAIAAIDRYMEDTGVEKAFDELSAKLLALPDLPYNPYPGFSRRMRTYVEKFIMFKKSDTEVMRHIIRPVDRTHIAYIVKPPDCNFIWGLKNIVECVDTQKLQKYEWLLKDITPTRDIFEIYRGYSLQIMTALVGPCVFEGTFYQESFSVDVRLEFLVTGKDLTQAVKMFINTFVNDIRNTENTKHILLGVMFPIKAKGSEDTWKEQFFNLDKINEKLETFLKLASNAVAENKLLTAEYLLCLDPLTEVYKKGVKQYSLNFIKEIQKNQQESEELHYFTEFALSTLYEGVFMQQTHAEAYISIFTPRVALEEKAALGATKKKDNDNKDGEKDSVIPPGDEFIVGSGATGFGPDAWQITAPIKSHLQRKVAGMEGQFELYDVAYYILLLILMEREVYEDTLLELYIYLQSTGARLEDYEDTLIELYRYLQSTGARLFNHIKLIDVLRRIVVRFQGNLQSHPPVMKLFVELTQGIENLFDNTLSEKSSDLVVTSKILNNRIKQIISIQDTISPMVQLGATTLEAMMNLKSYTQTLLVQLADDAVLNCPAIPDFFSALRTAFPEEVPKPTTPRRDRTKGRTGVRAGEGTELYTHGFENKILKQHDSQVINIQMCMQNDSAPKIVATESVILKYILDTHMDEVWTNYVVELVSGTPIPPNPFPRLVTALRQATVRMDLLYESEEKLTKKLLHGGARVEDQDNYVYHIPGCDVHGCETALEVLDTGTWFDLTKVIAPLFNNSFIKKRGFYKVAMSNAVNGSTMLYGQFDPYIREIVIHEHCYIRGPDGCSGQALELYSKIVFDHMYYLYRDKAHPISGVYFGNSQVRWSLHECLNKKKGFAFEFEDCLKRKEPVFLKFFVQIDWRYVPVLKYFMLHYMNEDKNKVAIYYEENPADKFRNIFLEASKAAFYFKHNSQANQSDPQSISNVKKALRSLDQEIINAKARFDWPTIYRGLLQRNLMTKGSSIVSEAWRMFNSTGCQVEYVISLGHSIQDLVKFLMDKLELKKSGQLPVGEEPDDDVNDVRVDPAETILTKMVMAFRQKVMYVLKAKTAQLTPALGKFILIKFKKITERDEITQELFLKIDQVSILVLDEICQTLQCIQDSLTYDVHCINPEAQALLHSLEVEFDDRPSSVDSFILRNPEDYTSHPNALVYD